MFTLPSPSQRPSLCALGRNQKRSASRSQMLQTMHACCCRCRQGMLSFQTSRRQGEAFIREENAGGLPELDLEIPALHMCGDIICSVVVQRNGWLRRLLNDTCSAEFQVGYLTRPLWSPQTSLVRVRCSTRQKLLMSKFWFPSFFCRAPLATRFQCLEGVGILVPGQIQQRFHVAADHDHEP